MSFPEVKSDWMVAVVIEEKPLTRVFSIENKASGDRLGRVLWRGHGYLFFQENDPRYEIEMYPSCLRAIADFIDALMELRASAHAHKICSCGIKFKSKADLLTHLEDNEDHYNATIGESISQMYARLAKEAEKR